MSGPPGGDEISLRFGPGVPPKKSPLVKTWRAGQRPVRRRRGWPRNLISSLVTIVIVGGAVWWLLLRPGPGLEVTAIEVQTPQTTQRCDTTVEVVGVLTTNGERGQVTYRWVRSDGDESGVLQATAERGEREVSIPLHWRVTGPGRLRAVATLELLTPGVSTRRASAAFDYVCR
jgi:hypothetical protein